MDGNVTQILQLLQSGTITAEQAKSLIEAINNKPSAEQPAPSQASTPVAQAASRSTAPQSAVPPFQSTSPFHSTTPPPTVESRQAKLSPTDLLLRIADDPSIREDEKLTIIIHATALLCTVLAVQPIPGLDLFFFTPVMAASALAMSRVMGVPLGKNGAGEVVASVLAVVGLGIAAEQIFILGAKIALPIFGIMALLPLLYATTYGVGYTIRAVLDARRNNQQISNDELRRIKSEAEKRAKAQQRDWTLPALKQELDQWVTKAEEFKQYERQYDDLQKQYSTLHTEMDTLGAEMMTLSQQKMDLEARMHELMDLLQEERLLTDVRERLQEEGERLQQEYDEINPKWSAQGLELEKKREAYEKLGQQIKELLENRFSHAYPGVRIVPNALLSLAELPLDRLRVAERQIAYLEFDPAKASYYGESFPDSQGRQMHIVRFDEQGQFYTTTDGSQATIHKIGKHATESRDIASLQSTRDPRVKTPV